MKMKDCGFVLLSPSGRVIADTFSVNRDDCWEISFRYLYNSTKWMKPFWKQWDASIEAAKKRGWVVVAVRTMVVRRAIK